MDLIILIIKPMVVLLLSVFLFLINLRSGQKAGFLYPAAWEYDFKLPVLLPLGLFLADKLVLKFYNPNRNTRLRNTIFNLHSFSPELFLKVHIIQKIVLVTAVIFIFTVISLLIEVDYFFVFFAIILVFLTIAWTDKNLDFKIKQRNQSILIELPEFINKVTLLVNAGLTLNAAVNKTVLEKSTTMALYKELKLVLNEVNNGKEITRAYEEFALRCRVPEITRFVSTVLQNVNRGSNELVVALRLLGQESWDKRKDVARKQGEEAASKLVFPMVMIFIAVAIIVLAPAVLTMGM